jgi:hypothetical protein
MLTGGTEWSNGGMMLTGETEWSNGGMMLTGGTEWSNGGMMLTGGTEWSNGGMMPTGQNQSSQTIKPVAIPLFPPQIPDGFTENVAGRLPEECTMNSVSGVTEHTKITILSALTHTAPSTHNRCALTLCGP